MSKKPYNVLKVREYTNANGEVKKDYIRVGVAFEIDSGGMSLEIHEGLSVTGRLAILPRTDKAADDGAQGE